MSIEIHGMRLGITRCYLIRGEGYVLIDCGVSNMEGVFKKALDSLRIDPEEISLIVITHGHTDHIGSAADIKKMTGADLTMHRLDMEFLEKGIVIQPPGVTGWGRLLVGIMRRFRSGTKISTTGVNVVIPDEGLSLREYGIPGRVIHTPGHTQGSVSVLLETGEAFVGDLAMNMFPLTVRPGLPIFAEDLQKVKESWRMLLDKGVETIFPAHGKPFPASVIRSILGPTPPLSDDHQVGHSGPVTG